MSKKQTYWYVGGRVRDQVMGLKFNDTDIAVEGFDDYKEMKEYFLNNGAKIYKEKEETLTFKCDCRNSKDTVLNSIKGPVDIVMCRLDGEYDQKIGRIPLTVTSASILQDLSRRDFTMNAMTINVENGIFLDPFNGMDDIKNKILKCVGDPMKRFREDPLRILRAIRFSIRFDLKIEEETLLYMKECRDGIKILSPDRVKNELSPCFQMNTFKTFQWIKNLELEEILFLHLKLSLKL